MNSAELVRSHEIVRFEWNSCIDIVTVIEPARYKGRVTVRDMQFAREYWDLLVLLGFKQSKSQLSLPFTLP